MLKPTTKQYTAKELYLRLLRYAWQYWPIFLLSILAMIVLSATNTGFLAAIKRITDHGFVHPNPAKLHALPWMIFVLMCVRALSGFIANFSMRWIARRVVEQLRVAAFRRMMMMPIPYFDAHSVGMLSSKLIFNAEQVSNLSTQVLLSLVRDSLTAAGLIGYMLYLDWKLTLLFGIMAPLIVLSMRHITPLLRAASKEVQESMGGMSKVLEESISGQRMVKIFNGDEYENERFALAASKNRRMQVRLGRLSGINSMVVEIISAAALAWVVYFTIGRLSAGEFAAFIGAVMMLISPIKSLNSINENIQVGLTAAQSLFEMIDNVPEADHGKQEITRAIGHLEFRDVGLRYDSTKRDALNNINIIVEPGEKIALVGRSGGGKTSLVNLLPRFYEFQRGEVLLDGINIREFSLHSLRSQFALVSQDVILFNDTVFNNIAYGVLRDSSEAGVIEAAKAAHAWEFIQQLPHGLQSEIGDRGVRLSGGQRQRLAIARAILKDAPILLLDEATSALDTESEKHVQAAFDRLMQKRTTFIIAHRLSTIENADRILVMEQGQIVENGTHAQLLTQGGHYAKLYHKQFH